MRVVFAIAGRDLGALLGSAGGRVVLAGFAALAAAFWMALLDAYLVASQDALFNPYAARQLNLSERLVAPFYGNLAVLLLLCIPAVSMRSFAEEQRQRTLELLLCAPIRPVQIVLGKYLGVLGFVLLLLGVTMHLPLSLWLWGSPDLGVALGGLLGMALLGGAVSALGLLASASTDRQIVALLLSLAASLGLWVLAWADADPTSLWAQLSVSHHLRDMLRGMVRASDVAYFLLLSAVALVATHERVAASRWA